MKLRTPTAAPGTLRRSLILGLLVLMAATLAQFALAARNQDPATRVAPRPFAPDRGPLPDGRLSEDALIVPSQGTTPFGFVLDQRDRLLVAEAFGRQEVGTANASAVSSYDLMPDAGLAVVSPSVDNLQTASCWIAATPNGLFAYVTNNASDSITGYRVGRDGRLELLDADGHSAATGSAPVDLAVSADGRYLYNVNAGSGTISIFAIHPDGSLQPLGEAGGLPIHDGAVGMAAR